MNVSSTPAYLRLQLIFGRPLATSRHSYAGLSPPFLHISGESGIGSSSVLPPATSSPTSEFMPLHEAKMGEISDEGRSDFAPVEVDVDARDKWTMKALIR
jgi:hypothetical protein